MSKTIYVKKVSSGIPTGLSEVGLRQLNDVNDSGLDATNKYLQYNDSTNEFVFGPSRDVDNRLTTLNDVDPANLSPVNKFLQYDSVSEKFIFTSLDDITVGVNSINGLTGDVILQLLDSDDVKELGLDSAEVQGLIEQNQVQVDSIDGGFF